MKRPIMSETVDFGDLELSDWDGSSNDSTIISCRDPSFLTTDISTQGNENFNDKIHEQSFHERSFISQSTNFSNRDMCTFCRKEKLCDDIRHSSLECDKFSTADSAIKIPFSKIVFKKSNTESSVRTRLYGPPNSENFQNTSVSRQTRNESILTRENKSSHYSVHENVFSLQGNGHKSCLEEQATVIQENPNNEVINISKQETSDTQIMNIADQKYSESRVNISNCTTINESKVDPKYIVSNHQSSVIQEMMISNQESINMNIFSQCVGFQRMITSSQESFKNQEMITLSQEVSGSQRMITSSQEISNSQKMITSSQEISDSQKIITSSQEIADSQTMITSSQEIADSQTMITSDREISESEKMISSSQENSNFVESKRIRKRKLKVSKRECGVTKKGKLVAEFKRATLKHKKALKVRKTKIFKFNPKHHAGNYNNLAI